MKMIQHGEKGFTLLELLIVVAILGIIAAVIIPNINTFMGMGTVSAANSEVENVKTAAMAYRADAEVWPQTTASTSGDYSFSDYYAGELKASYSFTDGFIVDAGEPGGNGTGGISSSYTGIHFEPADDVGHGKWVRDS